MQRAKQQSPRGKPSSGGGAVQCTVVFYMYPPSGQRQARMKFNYNYRQYTTTEEKQIEIFLKKAEKLTFTVCLL